MNKNKSKYEPIRTFRCTDELYLKLKFIALKENRSINKQLIRILTNFIKDYEQQYGEIKIDTNNLYE